MDFFDWSLLATGAGALAMVFTITQLTKDLPGIKKIPTQIWSYFVSLTVLYPAYIFTGRLNLSNAFLILFNGMITALAANGGFEALKNLLPQIFDKK